MSRAYYNEIDPHAAAWLRNLIDAGLIAPGDVDTRDIRDVVPIELSGYTQCHFFAGVGAWSHALRLAGWADDRPVWTGSCPCQPFSAAGRGGGLADERHLWPAWFHLLGQCRPGVVFGEQVADKAAGPWLDLVHTDLESLGYAVGPVVLPAAGVGAPHGRHRVFFVADADGERGRRQSGGMGEAEPEEKGRESQARRQAKEIVHGRSAGIVGDARREGLARRPGESGDDGPEFPAPERAGGPVHGFWADAEWLPCTDGKSRATEPGTFPLADGSAFRVDAGGPLAGRSRKGLLKGYGNAIVAPVAAEFIAAYLDTREARS